MIEYSRFTLDNGLRIIHSHNPHTAMVAVNLLYNVGSRDESPELTGMAHLFEHLMFAGSKNIPDFDGTLERVGGISNAWTSNDFTNFYDVAPVANVETLFWLESDRMLSLSFSEKALEVQRSVVIEEFKQTHLNRPYGDLAHHLRSLLYRVHPYRYPTIGKEIDHIRRITLDDIRRFYFSHYAPDNAVLAVTGNITAERTLELAEKWFGPIPRRDIAPRTYQQEPPIDSPREIVLDRDVPVPMVTVAFPMPGYGEKGYIECDLITDILANGRSSRFYKELVMGSDLFTEADASISGSEEPGFLMLSGRLTDNSPEAATHARSILIDGAMRLAEPANVSEHELIRAVNRFDSNSTFAMLNYLSKAQSLAMAQMHGEDINSIVPAYRAVTTADIASTARRVIDPQRAVTVTYHIDHSQN
ncbi:MAG: insulinase family protein [Lachnoclostridium sp.]|nr:insulinase family protein [Lachnoclostridium sp.]